MMVFFREQDTLIGNNFGGSQQAQYEARLRFLAQQGQKNRFKQAEPTPQQFASSQHKSVTDRILGL